MILVPLKLENAFPRVCTRRITFQRQTPYVGVPFADIAPGKRATIFADVAEQYDRNHGRYAYIVETAKPETNINGRRRGTNSLPYSWLRVRGSTERRVAAKSGTLVWDKTWRRWKMCFSSVKLQSFDDLILIVYLPWGLEMWEYDIGKGVGLTTQGVRTEVSGHRIQLYGKRDELCPRAAFHDKLSHSLAVAATHIVTMEWSHQMLAGRRFEYTRTHDAYVTTPMADMSPSTRGRVLENIARQIDAEYHAREVEDAVADVDVRGYPLGKSMRAYDWRVRQGTDVERVEAKSSSIVWDRTRWKIMFHGVKFECFDRLVLIIYAPWGVELYEYDVLRTMGVSATGKHMPVSGSSIVFYGPHGERSLKIAWDSAILPRVEAAASLVARLDWCHACVLSCLERFRCH